jgi:DNA primase
VYFSPEIVDEIQMSVSIEEVIKHTGYIVKGTGKSKGVEGCPKCGKDHTHIKINPNKNLFNCFSPTCSFKGNQFQWIMEVESLTFPQAVKRVADIGRVQLPNAINNNQELYTYEKKKQEALQFAIKFYRVNYDHEYLGSRGIKPEVASKYYVGFAHGGVNLKKFLNAKGFDDPFLLEIGLIRKVTENKVMDRFYNAIIIPDIREGRVFDIYGRSIDPKVQTKHIYLYGHNSFIGWNQIQEGQKVLICEAPIDVLSGYQLTGIEGLSTAGAGKFNNWHIYQIKKKKLSPIFANDNDESGKIATCEAVELCKEHNIDSKALKFVDGNDLNDLVKKYQTMKNYEALIVPGQHFLFEYQLSKMPRELILDYLKNY